MQIKSYNWFFDREKGRPCLVAGTAPTIENFPFNKFKGVYIACGDGPVRMSDLFKADYWINANSLYPIPGKHTKLINRFKDTVLIFSNTVYTSDEFIRPTLLRKILKVKWFAYEMLSSLNQSPGKDNRTKLPTIQEYIQQKFNMTTHYSAGDNMAIHMLAFAVLMGCTPIYLQGIEIPLKAEDYIHRPNKEADDFLVKIKQAPDGIYWSDIVRSIRLVACDPLTWPRVIRKALKRTILPNLQLKTEDCKSIYYDNIPGILADFRYLIDLAHIRGLTVINLSTTSTLNRITNLPCRDPLTEVCN